MCMHASRPLRNLPCRCDNLRLKFQQKDLDTDEWESVDSSAQVQHAWLAWRLDHTLLRARNCPLHVLPNCLIFIC